MTPMTAPGHPHHLYSFAYAFAFNGGWTALLVFALSGFAYAAIVGKMSHVGRSHVAFGLGSSLVVQFEAGLLRWGVTANQTVMWFNAVYALAEACFYLAGVAVALWLLRKAQVRRAGHPLRRATDPVLAELTDAIDTAYTLLHERTERALKAERDE